MVGQTSLSVSGDSLQYYHTMHTYAKSKINTSTQGKLPFIYPITLEYHTEIKQNLGSLACIFHISRTVINTKEKCLIISSMGKVKTVLSTMQGIKHSLNKQKHQSIHMHTQLKSYRGTVIWEITSLKSFVKNLSLQQIFVVSRYP